MQWIYLWNPTNKLWLAVKCRSIISLLNNWKSKTLSIKNIQQKYMYITKPKRSIKNAKKRNSKQPTIWRLRDNKCNCEVEKEKLKTKWNDEKKKRKWIC
jgi:hypothetical protein